MSESTAGGTREILFLTQVYPPDPAAVGQQLADVAEELARRGHGVTVLTADRGYDDPGQRYLRREDRHGVHVRRLGWCSFGKGSLWHRILGGLSFTVQAILHGLLGPRPSGVIVSTVPIMEPIAGLVLSLMRQTPLTYAVMDLNPDQLVALGVQRPGSLAVRLLDMMNRWTLDRARLVVVLDRFMRDLVLRKRAVAEKVVIIPPWPQVTLGEPIAHEDNSFREQHGLAGARVIMYAGNHSVTSPLTTLLQAAERLADETRLTFLFVGGGVGKSEVERTRSPRILSLPYQPLSGLRFSLSAADVHVVALGEKTVGIVHPCKVYGAMAVARPVLFLGPMESHVGDLIAGQDAGWRIAHGDVDGAVALLREIADMPAERLAEMGRRGRAVIETGLTRPALCGRFADLVEGTLADAPGERRAT